MLTVENAVALAIVAAFILYALLGGADFGGGVWDLLATGPRKRAQRALIARAIGPVWEVNHVWLIVGVVLLFSAFPRGFAALFTALHFPLTLFLVGVVFRGAAFTFRAYAAREESGRRRWGLVFSVASALSPALLGMCVGAIASGSIMLRDGKVSPSAFTAWSQPFAISTGALALCLFAFLAAVYLCAEAESAELAEDFRRRGLVTSAALFAAAAWVLLCARAGAPRVFERLVHSPFAVGLHLATALAALWAFWLLWRKRFRWARGAAALQAALIVAGWPASQYPYLIVDGLTLHDAAASTAILTALLWVLALGTLIALPCLVLLYRIFGRGFVRGAPPSGA